MIKTHTGTYGKGTLTKNNLTQNLLIKPQIYPTIIQMYPQYELTYLLEGTGRIKGLKMNKEVWASNSYEWFVEGRNIKTSTIAGSVVSGDGTSSFILPLNENYLNPNDTVKFYKNRMCFVDGQPTGDGPFYYKFQVISGNAATAVRDTFTFASDAALAGPGARVNYVSTLFPSGSDRGYSNNNYPDKYIQWISIHRKGLDCDGDFLGDVTWATYNNTSMWYWTEEAKVEKQMLKSMEHWRWYGRTTMSADGKCFLWVDGKPVIAGDGLIAQIEGINDYFFTSSSAINRNSLAEYMVMLATKAKSFDNNRWVILCGSRFATLWHEVFEKSVYDNGNMIFSYAAGKEIELGGNFTTYRIGTNTVTLQRVSIFDDEELHSERDEEGYLLESSRAIWLNMGEVDNESNISIIAKKGLQGDRGFMKRYIPGMINPLQSESVREAITSNAKDAFSVEWLSHTGLAIKSPFCCGMWVRKRIYV